MSCATRKPADSIRGDPLQSIIVGYPLQFMVVDVLGYLPQTSNGNEYILVAAYYFAT